MNSTEASPPLSRSSSTSSKSRNHKQLSLDLSDLPPLTQPSQPSNTLIITNLNDPIIFTPESLNMIRNLLERSHEVHTFSPLKSFRRIIVSFYNTDSAISLRKELDCTELLGSQIKIYFGEPTPINVDPASTHLQAPKSDKLFFISPPPSPPHGWEMRNEEPPNKEVHAADLAAALQKLHSKHLDQDCIPEASHCGDALPSGRQRSSSSTVVYRPEDHGDSPNLPAIEVEDTGCADSPEQLSPTGSGFGIDIDEGDRKRILHTARPPVELMEG